jgi:hypothetical protein
MNSVRQAIVDTLSSGTKSAVDVHAALRLLGFKGELEDVYVELVAMEGREQARLEPERGSYVWALGRKLTPVLPEFRSLSERKAELLEMLGRPFADTTQPPPPGVRIHRIR